MSCVLFPTYFNTYRRGRGLHLQCKTAPCRRPSCPRRVAQSWPPGRYTNGRDGWSTAARSSISCSNSGQAAGYWYYIPASAGKYIKRDIIIDVPHPSSPLLQYLQARAQSSPAMQNRAACPLSSSRRSLPIQPPSKNPADFYCIRLKLIYEP